MMQYKTKDFGRPATQRDLLLNGTREAIIRWLVWNDPNGVWSDADSAAEGWVAMTLEQARASMRAAVSPEAGGLKIAYSKSIDFDPNLPARADEEACKAWLRRLCRDFGLGFHPDTPASDYTNGEGLPFLPDVVTALDDSMDRAFEILDNETLYTVCAEVAEIMLAEVLASSESKPTHDVSAIEQFGSQSY
jgi:hypothetical protein